MTIYGITQASGTLTLQCPGWGNNIAFYSNPITLTGGTLNVGGSAGTQFSFGNVDCNINISGGIFNAGSGEMGTGSASNSPSVASITMTGGTFNGSSGTIYVNGQ